MGEARGVSRPSAAGAAAAGDGKNGNQICGIDMRTRRDYINAEVMKTIPGTIPERRGGAKATLRQGTDTTQPRLPCK